MSQIGVFDSGVGGLTILRGLLATLPQYDYVYLADSARAPYGSRSGVELYEFTQQAVGFLSKQDCSLIIFACNTASSEVLRQLQQYDVPKKFPELAVLGVLIPIAEESVSVTSHKKIGVVATEGTVRSGAFVREIKKIDAAVKVVQAACPRLVPLIESGETDSPLLDTLLSEYLQPLLDQDIDTLVLGCTHYEILTKQIKKIIGENVVTIGGQAVVPQKLQQYLQRHPAIDQKLSKTGLRSFYTTGETEQFAVVGSQIMGSEISGVIKVKI